VVEVAFDGGAKGREEYVIADTKEVVADTEADHCEVGEVVDMWEMLVRFSVLGRVSCPRKSLRKWFVGLAKGIARGE
jgi:hypothetical protein